MTLKLGKLKRKYLIIIMINILLTQEFNKLMTDSFAARLKQANLATNADIDDSIEKTDFDDKLKNLSKKVTSNKTKHVEVENKLTDLTKKVALISEFLSFCLNA